MMTVMTTPKLSSQFTNLVKGKRHNRRRFPCHPMQHEIKKSHFNKDRALFSL
jgi:hypothetical protein